MDGQDTLRAKLENLKRMNRNRFDYVLARSRLPSIEAALTEINLTKGWYYKFNEEERAYLEQLADELHYEQAIQAHLILVTASNEAARVKVDGLHSRNENVKQNAASEILDRTLGKAVQRNEVTGKDGGAIVVNWDEPKRD